MTNIDWSRGRWTHEPAAQRLVDGGLNVTAREGSDAWRLTSYGFVHDSEHALTTPITPGSAMEVTFHADFSQQFDQAGIFLRANEQRWIKAGVEYSDGVLQLGAVVTDGYSDWSVAPVPEWNTHLVTIRASWNDGAVTLRARRGDEPLRLVRVLPLPSELKVEAGPFVCAPTSAGLSVTFTRWASTAPDGSLH